MKTQDRKGEYTKNFNVENPKSGKTTGTVGFEQLHYILSTIEYDLTREMYLPQGNDIGYNLHPTGWIE